jgi:hypothetical protein
MTDLGERAETGRCARCGLYVDVYLCVACSFDTDYVSARRAPTWTSVSRSHQLHRDRAAQYDQLIACQTAMSANVRPAEYEGRTTPRHHGKRDEESTSDSEVGRSARIRALLLAHHAPGNLQDTGKSFGAVTWGGYAVETDRKKRREARRKREGR